MNIYYDFEFLEDGRTIDMISAGMTDDDGREYYAVNADAPWGRIREHEWLCENVVPHLPLGRVGSFPPDRKMIRASPGSSDLYWFDIDRESSLVRPKHLIANEIREFILATPDPQLWGWYCAYDHVLLAQLFGRMIDLPDGIPMHSNDLKQEAGKTKLPPMPGIQEHNALSDAREIRWRYHWYEQNSHGSCPCGHVVDGLCDVI